ncbi:patatin-like phospholipase family protein [Crateriforma spongiae]|uniref:patatin-like phospholipase family protein n=1 Tax=Crateriforma spongiae TaxID=2724528 RepID=UPI001446F263|nr:patatin-like phospholipase family protein [Crateriforma spongiae]
MKIALAFSGGGVRATVFHLGVLARLARQDLLGNVSTLSSVSGGSLAAGLVLSRSGYRWPSSEEYLRHVVPEIHQLLTTQDVQRSFVFKSLTFPWRLARGRASVLGDTLRRHWGIDGKLADLPESPRIIINATCYQTGKNWRFQRDVMGDYQTKYVRNPDFRLSHALAASAAVPGLIGSLVVKTRDHRWAEHQQDRWQVVEPGYKRLNLWDGGVYDNLGVESLFKPGAGLREGTDFLLVSDASRALAGTPRRSKAHPGYVEASLRLVDVATDQIRSLRARMLIDFFQQNPGCGAYLRLGLRSKGSDARSRLNGQDALTEDEVKRVADMETTLRRLSHGEFSLLFRHGYEVADATMVKHGDKLLRTQPQDHVQFKAA